ncbi:MAG: hypothetical protein WCJ35_05405 [Planctomycetota bacterium]
MFTSILSLDTVLQCLLPAFTQPSFQTHIEVLLGWVMCLGKRTEFRVIQTIQADTPLSGKERHPFDRFYNFFSRSAWVVYDLAHQVRNGRWLICSAFSARQSSRIQLTLSWPQRPTYINYSTI